MTPSWPKLMLVHSAMEVIVTYVLEKSRVKLQIKLFPF